MDGNSDITLTVHDYEQAIANALSTKQIELLQLLYSCPNKSATAKELALLLHPANPATIVANGHLGRLGKAIADFLNVIPGNAYQDEKGNWQGEFYGWYEMISD